MDAKMSGEEIRSEHHVVRTVGKQKWEEIETKEGTVVVVNDDVFLPRADYPPGSGPEEYVSADWLENFSGGLRKQLDQVREAVAARRTTRKVGRQSQLAVVLVNDIHSTASKHSKTVSVATTGEKTDPSHSGIYGLEPTDHLISQSISIASVCYPAYEPSN